MSDLDNDDTPDPEARKAALDELRQAADDGKKARADAELARRELAFAKAGIDTDKGVGKLLLNSYSGDATREAVLAFVEAEGIALPSTEPEPAQPAVDITPEERAQSRERAALSAQSEPPGGELPSPDPKVEAFREFKKGRDEGMRLEDAGASYFHTLFAAAYNGDKRAQFDPQEHAARAGEG